jgi:predicted transposase/invertase (TIGR01784 family)
MVIYYKNTQKGNIAMSITDELYEEAFTEGFTEGKIEVIRGMLKLNIPLESIMESAKITKDELDNIIIQITGENNK